MKIISFLICSCLLLATGCSSMKKNSGKNAAATATALAGTWVLDYVPTPSGALDSLYTFGRPELTFDPAQARLNGYSGCNRFNGPLVADKQSISFRGDIAMTMKACPGEGESVFMENLKKINRYDVSADGKTLTMIQGDIALMRFHKK